MQLNRMVRNLVLAGVLGGAGFALARLETPLLDPAHAAQPQARPDVMLAQAPAAAPIVPTAPAAAQIATPQAQLPNFTGLVQRYGPAVVNITVRQRAAKSPMSLQRRGGGDGSEEEDEGLSQFFRGLPFGGSPNGPQFRVPRGGVARGLGSGFIVSSDGTILTNAHVVDGATDVTVKLTDRREFTAKVIGSDKKSDIAVIKIDAKNLPVVSFGSSEKLNVGEWVVAIGSPFGFENSVTAGIVSAKSRALPTDSYPFIQTDVPVNPGNSGGPLFNLNGEVVGINSQIFSESGGFQGISFAVPIDIALHVKDQLVAHGKVTRARIGVTIQDVNQQFANSFNLPRPMGALVSDVEVGGPAAKAGLVSGDVIVKLDGRDIDRSSDLPARVSMLKPGATTHLQVWRKGKPVDVDVTLAEMKDNVTVARADATPGGDGGRLGVAVRQLRPEEAKRLGSIPNGNGLVVEEANGPAADAGIQPGDVILSFNGQAVESAEQLKGLIAKAGKSAALLVQRGRARIFVPVDLG